MPCTFQSNHTRTTQPSFRHEPRSAGSRTQMWALARSETQGWGDVHTKLELELKLETQCDRETADRKDLRILQDGQLVRRESRGARLGRYARGHTETQTHTTASIHVKQPDKC
jgi:hypothetical protein